MQNKGLENEAKKGTQPYVGKVSMAQRTYLGWKKRAHETKQEGKKHETKGVIVHKSVQCVHHLENTFRQIAIVLLRDLCLVGGTIKDGRIVVHVIDVNNDRRVVLVEIVRGDQA